LIPEPGIHRQQIHKQHKNQTILPGKMTMLVNKKINYYKRQATPNITYESWAIVEYASLAFRLSCFRAITEETIIVKDAQYARAIPTFSSAKRLFPNM
jgi:uncharacterized GH25 family protein